MSTSKMHANEFEADIGLVRRLLAAQAPQWAGLALAPVKSAGTDNALYRLGSNKVVRLPRVEWAAELIEKEQTWLPQLAPHLPLSIPQPLAMGRPGEGYPWSWSIYAWLEGDEASVSNLESPQQAAVALAEFILALEGQSTAGGPKAGTSNFHRGVPLSERDAPTRAAIASLEGVLEAGPLIVAWERALAVPEHSGPARWVHGDLRPGNLLEINGNLSAVIDFGCLGVGDPACHLQIAWNFFPAGVRDAFRHRMGADEAAWERGKGWALSIALIALPYYWNTNPVLADISRRTINEVLS